MPFLTKDLLIGCFVMTINLSTREYITFYRGTGEKFLRFRKIF